MYGVIHYVVKDMIVSQFGQEALDQILLTAGLEESKHFNLFYPYDDCQLEVLLNATSKCLGLSVETVLEVFGDYFIMFTLRHGYDDMLRTLGGNMTSFIQNLDSLHSLLALSYDKMVAPSFRCSTEKDGSLTLHYHSSRSGYYPLVKGLLCAAAREIFNQKIDIKLVSSAKEEVKKGRDQVHVTFHVTIPDQPEASLQPLEWGRPEEAEGGACEEIPRDLSPVSLNKDQFATAFPYHLIFDERLRLRQYGRNVARLSTVTLGEGMCVTSAFHIVYPRISFDVENIRRFINNIFILAVDPNTENNDSQMMWLADTNLMIFIGSPRIMSLKEMKRLNMYMADIPLYDVTREMVLLYQQRNAEIDITKKLDETTAELKRTSRELALEKQRTERLLYQMLPEKVANQLKNGQEVEAEKFDRVTVLFSDIVNFTEIAAACSPLDVVNMLNELYHGFDLITNEHKVYKVETIGDAYMVVSGVPDITDQHAQRIANFALDMVRHAGHVLSPDTGQPLQIRVGLHTGPVVAGVVGVKMPRYCLFGDTVNTASRMESHGFPSRIHLSHCTYSSLEGHGYLCRDRGEVLIKGKGLMPTYFLIGSRTHSISEPPDEHCSLPLTVQNGIILDHVTHGTQPAAGHRGGQNGYHKDLSPQRDSLGHPHNKHGQTGIPHISDVHSPTDCDTHHPENSLWKNHNSISHENRIFVNNTDNENSTANFVSHSCKLRNLKDSRSTYLKDNFTSFNDICSPSRLLNSASPNSWSRTSTSAQEEQSADLDIVSLTEKHMQIEDRRPGQMEAVLNATSVNKNVPNGHDLVSQDQSDFHPSVRNRRVNDLEVGRFSFHSKTCNVL